MADLKFTIEATAITKTGTVVQTRGFEIVMDEPEHIGGENTAPNPLEVMLASHAGCVNVISHIVAAQMGIQINQLIIEVSGNIESDVLFGKTKSERAGFKSIETVIKLACGASEEQVKEWYSEVMCRCPIADNLINPTPVNTYLKYIKST